MRRVPCIYCSEEHPVTLDRCPLTGQLLRAPVEALAAAPERAPFWTLIAEAARLYRRNVFVFAFTASIAFVPLVAVGTIAGTSWSDASRRWQDAMRISMQANREHRRVTADEQVRIEAAMAGARPDKGSLLLGLGAFLMLVPIFVVTQVLSHAALVPLVGDRALGGAMGPGRAWLAVGLHAGSVLWTATLSTAATMIGFLFCIAPGILAAIGFALAMPVVLLERRSGVDALTRSWRLMAREWPRVVGMWVVAIGTMMVLMMPVSALFFRLASDPEIMFAAASGWRAAALQLANVAVSLLVFPLPVIGTTLVYLHARQEQESIPLVELQLQMQRSASGV